MATNQDDNENSCKTEQREKTTTTIITKAAQMSPVVHEVSALTKAKFAKLFHHNKGGGKKKVPVKLLPEESETSKDEGGGGGGGKGGSGSSSSQRDYLSISQVLAFPTCSVYVSNAAAAATTNVHHSLIEARGVRWVWVTARSLKPPPEGPVDDHHNNHHVAVVHHLPHVPLEELHQIVLLPLGAAASAASSSSSSSSQFQTQRGRLAQVKGLLESYWSAVLGCVATASSSVSSESSSPSSAHHQQQQRRQSPPSLFYLHLPLDDNASQKLGVSVLLFVSVLMQRMLLLASSFDDQEDDEGEEEDDGGGGGVEEDITKGETQEKAKERSSSEQKGQVKERQRHCSRSSSLSSVLVHCLHGVSRSVTMVVALKLYQVYCERWRRQRQYLLHYSHSPQKNECDDDENASSETHVGEAQPPLLPSSGGDPGSVTASVSAPPPPSSSSSQADPFPLLPAIIDSIQKARQEADPNSWFRLALSKYERFLLQHFELVCESGL